MPAPIRDARSDHHERPDADAFADLRVGRHHRGLVDARRACTGPPSNSAVSRASAARSCSGMITLLTRAGTAVSLAETTAATACDVVSASNDSGVHGDREIGRLVGVRRMDDAVDAERSIAHQARRQRLCNFTHQHYAGSVSLAN